MKTKAIIINWNKLFPLKEDLVIFKLGLYSLAASMYELEEVPDALENKQDFIKKLLAFVDNNILLLADVCELLDKSKEEENESDTNTTR